MAPGSWTRDDLAALATGRTVRVSGPTGHDYPVPYWLGCAAGEVGDSSVADRVAARYAGDQGRYTEAWRAALANPGERYDVEYRSRLPGREGWWRERASFVNLMDRDDVRGIVVVTEEVGPGEVPRAEGSAIGSTDDDVVADWVLYWLDDQARVIALDGAAEAVVGVPPEVLIGRSPVEWLHPDGIAELVELWVHVTEHPGSSRATRQRVVRPDGREQAVDVTVTHRVREDGTSEYHAVMRDLGRRAEVDAARRDAEHRLARAEQERTLLADGLGLALFRCTPEGEVLTGDGRWSTLAGRLGAQPFGCIFDLLDVEGTATVRQALVGLAADDVATAEPRSVEATAGDGTTVLSLLLRATRFGGGPAIVGAARDVTDEVTGRRRSRHDAVTGLLNRATLEARLADALAHDRSGTLVVYLDLDHFGAVNDAYGHDAGDQVLEEVAERLRQAVRPGDAVCRYGGDEFVILCHDAADGAAVAVHRRIDDVLSAPIACGGGAWDPSASIGIARPTATEELADVIRRAGRTAADEKRKRHPAAGAPRTPAS